MPYNVHLKLHESQTSKAEAKSWFDQFVMEYEDAEHGRERIEQSQDPTILISGATLIVTSIQTLVTIYSILKEKPEVHYINLWGPDSEKFPVQVYSQSLGRISNPGQYDIYEVDDEVTLVVCDSMDEVRKVQTEIDPDGLVENLGQEKDEQEPYSTTNEKDLEEITDKE